MAAPLTILRRCLFLLENPILTRCRNFTVTANKFCKVEEEVNETEETQVENAEPKTEPPKVIDVDTSIRYLNSKAFAEGYRGKPVWFYYRRNFKGQIAPKTRKNCKVKGVIATASPCPICRDEYLVLDYKNTKLLEQFISPYSGEILDTPQTGLCQHQHKKLTVEIMKAWDDGGIEKTLPFRVYNYDDYKDN